MGSIGSRIQAALDNVGHTRIWLAQRLSDDPECGIDVERVTYWHGLLDRICDEGGEMRLWSGTVVTVCRVLGVTPNYLFGFSEDSGIPRERE